MIRLEVNLNTGQSRPRREFIAADPDLLGMGERRFAIIGHRAVNDGTLPLNDLAGAGGRMDVLVRAINTALFLSHGIRDDSDITLHLMGGPGPPRRIWFEGSRLEGVHADERAIAGQIAKVLREPTPPVGRLVEVWTGLWHSGGDISTTIAEWRREGVTLVRLDADAPPLWVDGDSSPDGDDMGARFGFFLSDDRSFTTEEIAAMDAVMPVRSLGARWIQGHSAIAVVHHLLDNGLPLDLGERASSGEPAR